MLHPRHLHSRGSSSSASSLLQPCHSIVRARHTTCRCTASSNSSSSRKQRSSVSHAAAAASTYVLSVAVAPGSDSDAQAGQQPGQQQACQLQREHEHLTHLAVRQGPFLIGCTMLPGMLPQMPHNSRPAGTRPHRLDRSCVLFPAYSTHISHRPADPTHHHKPNTTTI